MTPNLTNGPHSISPADAKDWERFVNEVLGRERYEQLRAYASEPVSVFRREDFERRSRR